MGRESRSARNKAWGKVGGDGFFLPGAMASGCSTAVFDERVALATAAWRSAHPEARRKQNNRARKRRRS